MVVWAGRRVCCVRSLELGGGTQPRAAGSFSFWLIYSSYLISQERAALDARAQLSSYLHHCPFSLQLSLLFFHFPSHPPLVCPSISCPSSKKSTVIIHPLLFLRRMKKGESQRFCPGNRLYEMDVIILETEAGFRGSASGVGAEHVSFKVA